MWNYFRQFSHQQIAYGVILLSTIFRIIIAASIEFGNDEVYYWLYALQPDISHFDHPPMVGFFIQLFTWDLFFKSEVFIRLAAIIPASISMWVVYKIGLKLKDSLTGLYAVLLYQLSVYGFVIAGVFILPDAPMVLFWLLGFYFFLKSLPNAFSEKTIVNLWVGFVFSGLALYSKYQAVFLLFGVFSYVVLFQRMWLKKIPFYIGFVFPVLTLLLIFYWNFENDFISFSFHQNRVQLWGFDFNGTTFLQELLGQLLYNNPYVIGIIALSVFVQLKRQPLVEFKLFYLFLLFSIPLILTVFYLSLYKSTLPHWSGIAYLTLLPLGALYLQFKKFSIKKIGFGIGVFFLILTFGVGVVNKGWFVPIEEKGLDTELGKDDFTLDMFGWEQTSVKIAEFVQKEEALQKLPIVIHKWFPGSHIHYYIAKPIHQPIYALGVLKDIHKYYWYNGVESQKPTEALFVTDSRNFIDPSTIYKDDYKQIKQLCKFPILRGGVVVKYVFLYKLSSIIE